MKLGDLPQHPDFDMLLGVVKKRLDVASDDVLGAARSKDLPEIKFAVGRQQELDMLYADLREAKRKAG